MRYNYVPGSIEAHDRSMLPGAAEIPEDACRVLVAQHVAERAELPVAGKALGAAVEWAVATHAVAERLATMELVSTHVLWITHRDVWAHVTWTDGLSPTCVVRRPYLHKVTFEALRVMLGLAEPPTYGDCPHCGKLKVKHNADGRLAKHRARIPYACA